MNYDDLNAEIARHRLSIPILAKQIGISKKALYSRIKGETQFKQGEIKSISRILNLNQKQVFDIFFADYVS